MTITTNRDIPVIDAIQDPPTNLDDLLSKVPPLKAIYDSQLNEIKGMDPSSGAYKDRVDGPSSLHYKSYLAVIQSILNAPGGDLYAPALKAAMGNLSPTDLASELLQKEVAAAQGGQPTPSSPLQGIEDALRRAEGSLTTPGKEVAEDICTEIDSLKSDPDGEAKFKAFIASQIYPSSEFQNLAPSEQQRIAGIVQVPFVPPAPGPTDPVQAMLDKFPELNDYFNLEVNDLKSVVNDPNAYNDRVVGANALHRINFRQFIGAHMQDPAFAGLMNQLGLTQDGLADALVQKEIGEVPITPPGPGPGPGPTPTPTVPTTFPMVVQNPSGKDDSDVYVRIQGTDPMTGNLCYLSYDKTSGKFSYHDIPNNTVGSDDGSAYCVKLSDLPQTAGGRLIQMLPLASARMFVSVGAPIQWHEPDLNNGNDPDNQTIWSMIEFTARDKPLDAHHPAGIWINYTAVDDINLPLELTTHTTDGKPDQTAGFSGNREELLNTIQTLMQRYDTPEGNWSKLVQRNGDGTISRIMAAKQQLDNGVFPKDFFQNYLEQTFLPFFADHDLKVDAVGLDGTVECYTGRFQNGVLVFTGEDGNVIKVSPQTDNAAAWLTGASGQWPDTLNPNPGSDAYKDIIRDLSALVNFGIKPEATQGPGGASEVTQSWMIEQSQQGNFYQTPAYNVYARACHEAGLDAYAYDYAERGGQDKTEYSPFYTDAGNQGYLQPTITVSLPDLSAASYSNRNEARA